MLQISIFYNSEGNLSDAWSEMEKTTFRASRAGGVYIIDAFGIIQRHERFGCTTFDKLQGMYLDKIIYCKPKDCILVHFVGDRYNFEPSVVLKQEEREKCGQSSSSARKEYEK